MAFWLHRNDCLIIIFEVANFIITCKIGVSASDSFFFYHCKKITQYILFPLPNCAAPPTDHPSWSPSPFCSWLHWQRAPPAAAPLSWPAVGSWSWGCPSPAPASSGSGPSASVAPDEDNNKHVSGIKILCGLSFEWTHRVNQWWEHCSVHGCRMQSTCFDCEGKASQQSVQLTAVLQQLLVRSDGQLDLLSNSENTSPLTIFSWWCTVYDIIWIQSLFLFYTSVYLEGDGAGLFIHDCLLQHLVLGTELWETHRGKRGQWSRPR